MSNGTEGKMSAEYKLFITVKRENNNNSMGIIFWDHKSRILKKIQNIVSVTKY